MKFVIFLVLFVFISYSFITAAEADTVRSMAPKIYMDCWYCDFDFIRSEIDFVNYVIDRKNADLHILITRQQTASGGREYTLTFIGQQIFSGKNDTLMYTTQQDDTDDDIRKKMVKYMKIGLMSYIAKTPIANEISISYEKSGEVVVKKDRWKNWVFRNYLNLHFDGEQSSEDLSLYGRISADRITEEWKIRSFLRIRHDREKYKIDDSTLVSTSKWKNFYGLVVNSLTNHWSIGISAEASSSTYSNEKASYNIAPAVEYNLFPYSQSTRRELRFLYRVGYEYRYYDEETIYSKMQDGLLKEALEIASELKQPWGTIDMYVTGSHFFHDFNKNHLRIYTDLSLRLFKGLSFNIYGGFSMIHDQLSLPKRGATTEEILLRRRELETQYSYWGAVGLEFTFGSIYNNIVNSRFGA